MSRARAAASSSQPSLANRAQGMLLWVDQDWEDAVTRWTEGHQQATLYPDGRAHERAHMASRSALNKHAWGVASGLMPHVRPDEAAAIGYALLKNQPRATWATLVDHRPSAMSPAELASGIMFEAARHLDETMAEAMFAHGSTLRDRNTNNETVLSAVARSVPGCPPSDLPHALGLFLRWAKAMPRSAWSLDDVRRVVAFMPSAITLATVGERPLRAHLHTATHQAISYNCATLVKTWLPHIMVQAKAEQSARTPPAGSPATERIKDALPLATASSVDLPLLRWLVDQVQPQCAMDDAEKAFNNAASHKRWDHMEVLWPHVHPHRVLMPSGNKPSPVARDVEDWILVRVSPAERERWLPEAPQALEACLAELPLTRARRAAEQREASVAAQAPARVSRRLRS